MAVVNNRPDRVVEAVHPGSFPDLDPETGFCLSCDTKYPDTELLELPCDDKYCGECLTTLFEIAMRDEELFPPKCCGLRIPLKLARSHLPSQLSKRFRMNHLELSTKTKFYCCKPTCSAFIAPHSIHNGQAICQTCRTVTCSKCRNKWHYGPCAEGDDSSFFDLVRSKKWKKCPICLRFVEKALGCNLVLCRCGTEFCYGCGKLLDKCCCSFEEEDAADLDHEDQRLGVFN